MKRLVVFGISIFALLLINYVSAQEINLDYPEEVNYGEVFEAEVELINFSEDLYDIKIDIKGGGIGISKILNNGTWKTTYNYVLDAIDSSQSCKSSFSLNITGSYNGSASIEVKTRDSSGKIKTFSGYQIKVLGGNEANNPENDPEDEENNPKEEENNLEEEEDKTYLELKWDKKDITNGEEFNVEISAFNLEDKMYDLKLYIYDEDEKIMSEIFDEEQDKWKSSQYYLTEILEGPGEERKTIKLRIKKGYKDFSGNADIMAKIRKTGTSSIVEESSEGIRILEGSNEEEDPEGEKTLGEENYSEESYEENEKGLDKEENKIIKLGNLKAIKQETDKTNEKGSIIYESKSEKIKKYSIYIMNIILIGIIIFLLINFKNREKQ
jgi:hypothetical protein